MPTRLVINAKNYVVVIQSYETDVIKEFAIRGNAAIMKCQVPSYVADFVVVISWHTSSGEEFRFHSGIFNGK